MAHDFDVYLKKIRGTALSEQTEHTSRSALENLLNDFAAKAGSNRVQVVHEPTRQQGFGAPDFKIKSKGMTLGYVELKAIGTNLDKELKSDQFKKYRTLSDNILVTDYLQWIWLDSKTGKAQARERLIEESDLEGKSLRINPEKAAAGDFADPFAQMLAYSLFLARLNAGANTTVTLENVCSHIPGSFRLNRELVRFLEEMNEPEYEEAKWIGDEVLSIVNGLDLAFVQDDLSFRSRKAISHKVRAGDEEEHSLFERDPFNYFYEDFLEGREQNKKINLRKSTISGHKYFTY
jgi:hypothetical protein